VETPPELAEYHALAMGNPDDLPGLATKLEEDGKIQRALLAHERIIDSTRATPQRLASSVQDVRRLRALLPPWNPDPEKSLPLTLHAGTAGQNADRIAPIIEKFAAEISAASAGIVRVLATVHRGNDPVVGSLPPPVAIWLSGGDDANATPLLSFTLAEDEDPQAVIFETLLKILRGEAARDASPQHIPAFDSPEFDHITRLVWEKIGLRLNPPKS
jgi:hypothetical protein